ncbi:MAG TPA: hypothetical protein VLG16_02005 [Candidatus Saccharimonadales bacterium]|nr:hypothetical protein [Candidatus Saccharimonadales bacterium]
MIHGEHGGQVAAELAQQGNIVFALGGIGMAENANLQLESGFLPPEFLAEHEQFYVPRNNKQVLLGCGDDRQVTLASAQKLTKKYPEALSPFEGYASIYGGAAGIVKVAHVVGIAQYGKGFYDQVGGFEGLMQDFAAFSAQDKDPEGVIPTLHSAEKSEAAAAQKANDKIDASVDLCEHGVGATGCAYCGGVGATSHLLAHNSLIRSTSHQTLINAFGDDRFHTELSDANGTLAACLGEDFNVGRQDYVRYTDPTDPNHFALMILAGDHIGARRSGVITNYDLHTVRNSAAAHKASADFYSQDVGIATQVALRAFKRYNLDPEMLLRAFEMDAVPVRAVLVSHDADADLQGKAEPQPLGTVVRGDWRKTLAELH